jgi:hypothetical protein
MARGNPAASPVRRRPAGAPKTAAVARAEAIFARLAAANPEPKSELEYVDAFTLLVAVVLSAQATDAGVNKATRALFAVADTPAKMAALGEAGLVEGIKTIGLYRTKAKNVVAITVARFRLTATRSRRCRASAARPPMWCSTLLSARRRSRSTPMSSASPTAFPSPKARRRARSRTG